MLGLLVYGYATGIFSSRKIERATYNSVAFRYLAAGHHPDHDTLATFRRRFLDELAGEWTLASSLMRQTIANNGVASIPESRELCIEADVKLIGCQMTVDLFGFGHADFIGGIPLELRQQTCGDNACLPPETLRLDAALR